MEHPKLLVSIPGIYQITVIHPIMGICLISSIHPITCVDIIHVIPSVYPIHPLFYFFCFYLVMPIESEIMDRF